MLIALINKGISFLGTVDWLRVQAGVKCCRHSTPVQCQTVDIFMLLKSKCVNNHTDSFQGGQNKLNSNDFPKLPI